MRFNGLRLIVTLEVLIVILLFSFSVIQRSSFFEDYQTETTANDDYCHSDRDAKEHQKSKECQGLVYKTLDDPVALFTGLLVVATIALFVVTYWLFQVAARESDKADEALRIARTSAEASLKQAEGSIASARAHIRIVDFEVDYLFEDLFAVADFSYPQIRNVGCKWRLHNLGNTPADIFSVACGAQFAINHSEMFPAFVAESGQNRTLAVGEKSWQYYVSRRVEINEAQHKLLIRRTFATIWFEVDVLYLDVFGVLQEETVYWKIADPVGISRHIAVAMTDRRKLTDRQGDP